MSTHSPVLLQGYIPARAHVRNTHRWQGNYAGSLSEPESQETSPALVMQPAFLR